MTIYKTLPLAAASVVLAGLGASVAAETITLGSSVVGASFSGSFNGATVPTNSESEFDLNGDGFNDIYVEVYSFVDRDSGATIEEAYISGIEHDVGGLSLGSFTFSETKILVSDDGGLGSDFVTGLAANDPIGAANNSGSFGFGGSIYQGDSGLLGAGVGTTGFLGFSLTTSQRLITLGGDDCDSDVSYLDQCVEDVDFKSETVFGWLEVTRGSAILGGFAAQTGSINAGVTPAVDPMTPVPLPAGLPLLLAGLGAFGFLRSRKSA